jgi:hypothetical protein
VAGCCEHGNETLGPIKVGNEPLDSIKGGEFFLLCSCLLGSQEGLCSMELVS